MALFYKLQKGLAKKERNQSIKLLISFILVFSLAVLTYKESELCLIILIIGLIWINKTEKKLKKIREKQFIDSQKIYHLDRLKDFHIISNVKIILDGVIKQVEVIGVGTTGIFVIEKLNSYGTNRVFECNYHILEVNGRIEFNTYNALAFECSNKGMNNMENYFSNKKNDKNIIKLEEKIIIKDKVAKLNNTRKLMLDVCYMGDLIFSIGQFWNIKNIIKRNSKKNNRTSKNNYYKIENQYIDNSIISTNTIMNENMRFQQGIIDREFMEFSRKSVTSFDEGGFVQGSGLNMSDTMMNNMF